MSQVAESWLPIAKTLGYESEEQMLKDLYVEQEWSIGDLVKKLGYSQNNLRRRMTAFGIVFRKRGGKNNLGKRLLAKATDAELQDVKACMKKYKVHVSTVLGERRRRKQCDSVQSSLPPTSIDSVGGESNTSLSHNSALGTPSTTNGSDRAPGGQSLITERTRENESTSTSTNDSSEK